MNKIKQILSKDKTKVILMCFITSLLFLTLLSKNSFLYGFNDWEDANAFFTLGKSLFSGKIIYKDIFEQKGPFLYFIYGIGYLISNFNFLGVFFLEIIFSTVFLYYIYKIINLYLDSKYGFIIIPIFTMLLYSSSAFRQGGSCEEFTFPFLAITIYNLLNFIKKDDIKYSTVYITGILAGLIFLMKYTLLGINFAFMAYLFFALLRRKQVKKAFISAFIYIGGMLTAFLPWLIYFLCTNSLYSFYDVYIYTNLFAYTKTSVSIIDKILNCFICCYKNLKDIGIHILILIGLSLLTILFNKEKRHDKLAIICLFVFTVLFVYIGGIYFKYYGFPVLLFILFILIFIFKALSKKVNFNGKLFIPIFIISLIASYYISGNTKFIGKDKNEYAVYKFKDIIMQEENPTLLNYGWLDCGFYTVTGIVPNTKYFERQNFEYKNFPENMDEQNKYIENKDIDFVVTAIRSDKDYPVTKYLDINYNKVMEFKVDYNYAIETFALYKLKK